MEKHAVLLAGGFGKRLLPITETIPKPLLPLGSSTVYETAADALIRHGFTDIAVTTMYKAEMIEAVPISGAKVCYCRESVPLGTAGSVKSAAAGFDDSFLVVSGDTVCDFDLAAVWERHKAGGAAISVVCTRVQSPTEYGAVIAEGGRITRFVEKPSWQRTLTNLVNTGIYVIEPEVLRFIGEGKQDFASDLFPSLAAAGIPIRCIEEEGYWCDIGSVESYYRCCFRAAKGAKNVLFGRARTATDSAAEGCILFDGAAMDGGSAAYGSILCEKAHLCAHSFVGEGCVIGAGTVIGEGAYVSGGTALRSGLIVEKGARIMKSIIFGEIRKRHLENGKIKGRYGSFINGELCLSLGGALSFTAGAGSAIGVMHGEGAEAKALAESVLCGVRIYGGRGFDLEDGFGALCAFSAKEYALSFAVMVEVRGSAACLTVYDGDGLFPTDREERAIEAAIARPAPTAVSAGERVVLEGEDRVKYRYARALTDLVPSLEGLRFSIKERNAASEFLYASAEKLGASVSYGEDGGDVFYVSPDGTYAEAALADGTECSFWGLVCVAASLGGEAALPALTPRFVEDAVAKNGGKCVFYGETGGREREAAYRCFWTVDGTALALRALYAAKKAGKPLYELSAQIPKQTVEEKTVRVSEEDKAETISRLYKKGSAARGGEGVLLRYSAGSVVVVPQKSGCFRMFAEAVSSEAAEELLGLTEKEIRKY